MDEHQSTELTSHDLASSVKTKSLPGLRLTKALIDRKKGGIEEEGVLIDLHCSVSRYVV